MSDQGERPIYDPAEVRRCIALSFSTKDLRDLAESLGATGIGAEGRGIQDVAREVVRHFERQGTLDRLVAKLAEARPLMEWPAPTNKAKMPAFPAPPEFAPPAAAPAAASAPATAPATATATAPAPAPAPVSAPAPAPVIRDPYAAGWPGTAPQNGASPSRSVEGRKVTMMIAIGGVTIALIAIGAFLVGRAGSKEGPAPLLTGKDAQAKGERPMRESGAARLAADAVTRSFGHLARGCDLALAPNEQPGPFLFKAAYEQCGSRPTIGRPPGLPRIPRADGSAATAEPPPDDPTPEPLVPRTPRPTTDRTPKPGATADKPPPPDAATACMDKCAASLRSCNGSCGPEPTSSSQYGSWQSCKSQCLAAVSKCRLDCQ